MPGYDLHPGVDAEGNFPPLVRETLVASPEMQAALNELYGDATDRENHSGTQPSTTISDWDPAVRSVLATTDEAGTAELATSTEVQAMTDASRIVTPAGLAAAATKTLTGGASRLIRRDASGRAEVEAPALATDIANKHYVDNRGANAYPAFEVRRVTLFTRTGTTGVGLFAWDDTPVLNNGGYFDNVTNHRFTAPVKGIYLFNCNMNTTTASTVGPQMEWWKNGSVYKTGMILYTTSYLTASCSLRTLLNAGDYIDVRVSNNNNSSISIDGSRSSFGGHLVSVVA